MKCSKLGPSAAAFCVGMQSAIANVPENYEGKGLTISRGWLGDEKQPRLLGIVYRARNRGETFVLNFCPWCGADIRFDK